MNADRWDTDPIEEPETPLEAIDRACWSATVALEDLRQTIQKLTNPGECVAALQSLDTVAKDVKALEQIAAIRAEELLPPGEAA